MRRILLVAFVFTICFSQAFGQSDQEIEAAAQKALRAYSLSAIETSIQNNTITLTGLVNLCRDKLLAIETIRRIHGVMGVIDRIIQNRIRASVALASAP